MLFRGTQDGRVLAYDFKTGKRLWETTIADPKIGESSPAAPIAWNGLVFIGNAGGDIKGVKGRMYALDAKTGKIVWEFYLVPKAAGDRSRGPQGAIAARHLDLEKRAGHPDHRRRDLDLLHARPRQRACSMCRAAIRRPDFATGVREGGNLFSGSVVVLDAKTGAYKTPFQDRAHGLARLGRRQARPL